MSVQLRSFDGFTSHRKQNFTFSKKPKFQVPAPNNLCHGTVAGFMDGEGQKRHHRPEDHAVPGRRVTSRFQFIHSASSVPFNSNFALASPFSHISTNCFLHLLNLVIMISLISGFADEMKNASRIGAFKEFMVGRSSEATFSSAFEKYEAIIRYLGVLDPTGEVSG